MKGLLRIAFLAVAVLLVQGTWALAGVTGSLNGTVELATTHAPVAQAKVTATSASQTSSTTTDNGGHFGFVSLVPDTYTVTASKENVIEPVSQRGVTVLADQVQNVALIANPPVKTIGTVLTRASTDLVKPGTTANVYSVNESAQARSAVLGGGGGANQGYSAIAALPGAYVPPGQAGWFQDVYIRGGDYDQVGYEFDGVPVNRSFDNYPTTNLSALGQQELQLYTGAAPASAESQGLAGYINQVIKSGTYPGFGTINLGIGGPALYNKANIEFGGATPNRNFSYYVGVGLVNQDPRYIDNSNGASVAQTYGSAFDILTAPAGHARSPTNGYSLLLCRTPPNPLTGTAGGPGPAILWARSRWARSHASKIARTCSTSTSASRTRTTPARTTSSSCTMSSSCTRSRIARKTTGAARRSTQSMPQRVALRDGCVGNTFLTSARQYTQARWVRSSRQRTRRKPETSRTTRIRVPARSGSVARFR